MPITNARTLIHPARLAWLGALVLACLWLALLSTPAFAQSSANPSSTAEGQRQPIPALTARVMDTSGTLSSSDVQALSTQLQTLETETGTQVVVLMVPTTAPEEIAAYAWRVASTWKLGRKDVGDGALIIVAKNDRRMRIEVARKLEGAIPDILAGRIIDDAMKPRFRSDDYAGGLSAAITQMGLLIRGEKLPPPTAATTSSTQPASAFQSLEDMGVTLAALLLFGFPLLMGVARQLLGRFLGSLVFAGLAGGVTVLITSNWLTGGAVGLACLVFSLLGNTPRGGRGAGPYISSGGAGGAGGWSSGSRSGGGFSSGGGGSFGGGGASGSW